MRDLHLPWLEISILIPLVGALVVSRMRDLERARSWTLIITGIAFLCAVGEWVDFATLGTAVADDPIHLMYRLFGHEAFFIDHFSAPLFSLGALLYFLTTIATLRTKVRRFSFAGMLISETILLATLSCTSDEPWLLIALLGLGTLQPYFELRARGKSSRVYLLHMALFVGLLVVGQKFVDLEKGNATYSWWAMAPLLIAVMVRNGIAPFHCWATELFENASFGTALLFVAPMTGAFAAVRLVLPVIPDEILRNVVLISLVTSVYAASMSLIQRDARRFFCYLFLSHSAMVLFGIEMVTQIGLTGALCVWLSVGLSLGGLGLTLRALESRCGRLSLVDYQGHYEHTPNLAMCYLLTGLASVGFPGTLGFVGTELLVDSAVDSYPYFGIAVVIAAAINGIAIVQAYFLLFTGKQYFSSVSLLIRTRERFAVLVLAGLILIGGIIPQPNISSRNEAVEDILKQRAALSLGGDPHVRRLDEKPDLTHIK